MEESKDPIDPTDKSFPTIPQTQSYSGLHMRQESSDDLIKKLVFKMKDGSEKSIERTDKLLGKGG